MQKIIFAAVLFLISSCGNNDTTAVEATEDSVAIATDADLAPGDRLIWISDFDTTKGEFFMRQVRTVIADSLQPAALVANINAAWDSVELKFDRVSHDTIYVSIPESEYLSQQMGSAGAQSYMASTTFNLTELKGVQYVTYSMTPGDHVSPGTFSRQSFENYR
jgi:hypothetical protein